MKTKITKKTLYMYYSLPDFIIFLVDNKVYIVVDKI